MTDPFESRQVNNSGCRIPLFLRHLGLSVEAPAWLRNRRRDVCWPFAARLSIPSVVYDSPSGTAWSKCRREVLSGFLREATQLRAAFSVRTGPQFESHHR